MRTPSLRGRVVLAGVATSTALLVGVDLFVWFNLRDRLYDNLDGLLESRAQLVREIGPGLDPSVLDQRLTARGVPAIVRPPGGGALHAEPVAPDQPQLPPAGLQTPRPADLEMDVGLPNGTVVTVLASRAGAEATLQRVLVLELVGSLAAVGLLGMLLVRVSGVALGPLDEVVQTARRIAAGNTGERLDADRRDTELGRMATAFDEMLDALEAALREARGAERRSREFLAQAAHQLRTPVATLQASVDALLRIDDPAQREVLLDHLAAETARSSRLVRRLLRMAELDDAGVIVRRPTDMDAVIVAETARAATRRSDVGIAVEGVAGSVEADSDAIAESLANVLENAVQHADSRVLVRVESTEEQLRVHVTDDGPGVPPTDRERIFQRFVSGTDVGAGLGLSIARSIARAHGGDVTHDGEGFVVGIPRDGAN